MTLPGQPRRSRLRRLGILILAVVLVAAAAAIAWVAISHSGAARRTGGGDSNARAPDGARVRVEVLNATGTRGLARRATMHLRDRGFDVVFYGTASERRDSTLVLDRTNHPEWSAAVRAALGSGRVEARADSSRYLDVTVLLGRDWRPPAEPFYP